MTLIQPPRRSHRRVLLPTALMLILAVLWSAAWFYMRGRADEMLTRALADQAAQGRTLSCADRSLGGYPFRLEFRCREARLKVARQDSNVVAQAPDLLAVAQVYDPRHVILELTGPLTVATPDDGRTLQMQFTSAEASFVAGDQVPERGDLVFDGLSAKLDADPTPWLSGAHLELHARRSPDDVKAPDTNGAYDVAARLDAQTLAPLDQQLGNVVPVSGEFQGTVTGLGRLGPAPLPDRLRSWAEAGGRMQVVLARLSRGASALRASGDLALDDKGRPAGHLVVALAGLQELGGGLKTAGFDSGNLVSLLGLGLQVLGKPTNIDGKPAAEVPITLQGGRASAGAFPLGKLPSLY